MSAEISSFSEQMAMGKLHKTTHAHRRAVRYAMEGIEALLDIAPRCYVSLSFGKQSIIVAHMAQRIRPEIPMYFLASSETWDLHDYEPVVAEYCGRFRPRLKIVQTDRMADAESWKQSRDAGDQDLQRMCPREEWDGWLWGLAMDESRPRRITLAQGVKQCNAHPTIYRYKDGKYRGCPIMRWGINDIAAYIVEHDLPLLSLYRKFGLTQRTTARLTKTAAREGAMALARFTAPAAHRITNRFPEVKLA